MAPGGDGSVSDVLKPSHYSENSTHRPEIRLLYKKNSVKGQIEFSEWADTIALKCMREHGPIGEELRGVQVPELVRPAVLTQAQRQQPFLVTEYFEELRVYTRAKEKRDSDAGKTIADAMLACDRTLQHLVLNEYPMMHQERNVQTFYLAVRKCQKADPGETSKETLDKLERDLVEFRNGLTDEHHLSLLKWYRVYLSERREAGMPDILPKDQAMDLFSALGPSYAAVKQSIRDTVNRASLMPAGNAAQRAAKETAGWIPDTLELAYEFIDKSKAKPVAVPEKSEEVPTQAPAAPMTFAGVDRAPRNQRNRERFGRTRGGDNTEVRQEDKEDGGESSEPSPATGKQKPASKPCDVCEQKEKPYHWVKNCPLIIAAKEAKLQKKPHVSFSALSGAQAWADRNGAHWIDMDNDD